MNNPQKPKSLRKPKRSKKKRLFSLLTSRFFIILLLIALQLAFLVGVLVYLSQVKFWITAVLNCVSFLVVLWILSKDDNPSYKMAWIILIMAVPLIGGFFYLMFGNKHIGRRMNRQMEEYSRILLYKKDSLEEYQAEYIEELRRQNPMQARQAEYIHHLSHFPMLSNTESRYFSIGERFFESLKEELSKAKQFILLEYFIIQEGVMWDSILEILEQKLAQGVAVYLLYDDMGCIQTLPGKYDQTLREKGFRVGVFNPFQPRLTASSNYRDHRKICVIDGSVGYTGGINLADEYINAYERYGHWKDTAVMLRGEAVRNLTEMFLQLWEFTCKEQLPLEQFLPSRPYPPADGFVQPFGDSPLDTLNIAENAYMQIINHAKEYVYITTPYLILDNEMVTALEIAAQSGVDLRIMTPHIPDKWYVHHVTQSFYRRLLEAGVRIYEYTPGFIHAKTFVSDDATAIVGTTNMDFRSFYLHFECGIVFYNSSTVLDVKRDFLRTQHICSAVTLSQERKVHTPRRILRSLLRGFSPLM